jgi:hypothetical protein
LVTASEVNGLYLTIEGEMTLQCQDTERACRRQKDVELHFGEPSHSSFDHFFRIVGPKSPTASILTGGQRLDTYPVAREIALLLGHQKWELQV